MEVELNSMQRNGHARASGPHLAAELQVSLLFAPRFKVDFNKEKAKQRELIPIKKRVQQSISQSCLIWGRGNAGLLRGGAGF